MTMTALRDLNDDERVWGVAAIVALHDGESQHYRVSDEGAMLVTVVTKNHGSPMECLLGGGGLNKSGIWFVPPIDTEVFVGFPDGEYEGDPVITAFIGHCPGNLVPGTILIIEDSVEIRSLSGVAVSLAKTSEVAALANFVQGLFVGGTGSVVVPPGTVPQPVGTQVLKAE